MAQDEGEAGVVTSVQTLMVRLQLTCAADCGSTCAADCVYTADDSGHVGSPTHTFLGCISNEPADVLNRKAVRLRGRRGGRRMRARRAALVGQSCSDESGAADMVNAAHANAALGAVRTDTVARIDAAVSAARTDALSDAVGLMQLTLLFVAALGPLAHG